MPILAYNAAQARIDSADRRLRRADPDNDSRGYRKGWQGQFRAMRDTYGFTPEAAESWARPKRDWKEGRLEELIALIWGTEASGDGGGLEDWPEPDIAETERVVAESKITVDTLRLGPRNRVSDYSQAQITESLFYPNALVCAGLAFNAPNTWPIETILGSAPTYFQSGNS